MIKLTLMNDTQIWEEIADTPRSALKAIQVRMDKCRVPRPGEFQGDFHNVRFGLSVAIDEGMSFEYCVEKLAAYGFTYTVKEWLVW